MTERFENYRMPIHLPWPESPAYSLGTYGGWALRSKPRETMELGYFTGRAVEPSGHFLVKDGHCWMSTSRLERESHAIHMKYATGNVVVCGVGMGMYLFNIAGLERVNKILAVDLDPSVISLVQRATNFESWPGFEKITFVNKNALEMTPADIGMSPVDYLYVDIWPELGNPEALAQTRAIQLIVEAEKVGWWGQEIDFMDWLWDHRPKGHQPVLADLLDFTRSTGLPMEERSLEYLKGCLQASDVFGSYRATLLPVQF